MRQHPAVYVTAAIAAAIGIASLMLFGLYLWGSSFELISLGMNWPTALAWDAALCVLFFIQHSGMVRRTFRTSLARFVSARWHGIIYTIASGVVLALLVTCWQPSRIELAEVGGPLRLAVRAVFVASLLGFVWGARSLERFDAFGVDAALMRLRVPQPGTPLSQKGPYRFVRHPFYAFGIIAIWATPSLSLDRLLFNTLWTCWIVLGAKLEEGDLLVVFGESYRSYQRQTPMLIPRWRRPVR